LIIRAPLSDNCVVLEYQYRRQRILITLIGVAQIVGGLLKIIDAELEATENRELIGFPIYGVMTIDNKSLQ
jgi:hypothetical protein